MVTTAIWRTPHLFVRLELRTLAPAGLDETPSVFRLGPVFPELLDADFASAEGIVTAARRLGFDWLASLRYSDRVLAPFLKDELGVASPGEGSSKPDALAQGVPREVIAEFLAQGPDHEELALFQEELRFLAADALEIAGGRQWSTAESPLLRDVEDQLARERPPLVFRRLIDRGEQAWAFGFVNLRHRALMELLELYTTKPRLATCSRCGQLFVQKRAAERFCRRGLLRWSDAQQLESCSGSPVASLALTTAREQREYTREYKRLRESVRTARLKYRVTHPETLRRQATFDAWQAENPPRPRGRKRSGDSPPEYPVPL